MKRKNFHPPQLIASRRSAPGYAMSHPDRLTGQPLMEIAPKPGRCTAKTRAGKPCQAPPLRGRRVCLLHSGRASEMGSKGGRRRAVFNPQCLEQLPAPKTAAGMRDLLATSIMELRGGRLDPKMSNALSCLAASFLKALEISDLETRLDALERKVVR